MLKRFFGVCGVFLWCFGASFGAHPGENTKKSVGRYHKTSASAKSLMNLSQLIESYYKEETLLVQPLLTPCKRIVNLGCGVGNFIQRHKQQSKTLIGIDRNQALLDKARDRFAKDHTVQLYLGDICALPNHYLTPETAVVFDYNTFPLISPSCHAKILQECGKARVPLILISLWKSTEEVTKKRLKAYKKYDIILVSEGYGGLVLKSKSEPCDPWPVPIYHRWYYQDLLEAAGYEVHFHEKDLVQVIEARLEGVQVQEKLSSKSQ